jgi:hypothetical protein
MSSYESRRKSKPKSKKAKHTHTHTEFLSFKLFDLVRFSTKSSSANPQIGKKQQQQKHARAWFLFQLFLFSYTKSSFTNHRRTHKPKDDAPKLLATREKLKTCSTVNG